MKGWAELVFETPHSRKIYHALAPELEDEAHRSRVELVEGPGFVRLKISGEDVVSLRAALNTWIRLVKIAIEMVSL
ncbi:KEOPS complex subunit Pcc1 [Methanothrix sp.]|uniref:KEOPS complex subunit Pcc1 n=1 Tax=Methanothrix sp. TaxID=90426 RepID=UPI003C722542